MQELDRLVRGRDRSLTDLYDALANDRRRTTLATLTEVESPVDGETLARYVAEAEQEALERGIPDETVERIHASLYHVHLPRLDAAGLLEYDPDRDVVVADAEELKSLGL